MRGIGIGQCDAQAIRYQLDIVRSACPHYLQHDISTLIRNSLCVFPARLGNLSRSPFGDFLQHPLVVLSDHFFNVLDRHRKRSRDCEPAMIDAQTDAAASAFADEEIGDAMAAKRNRPLDGSRNKWRKAIA